MKGKTFTILIIDDDEIALLLLETILEEHGYNILKANNGPEARQIAGDSIPDLILSDVEMGEESGFDVCEKLRDDPKTADIPIVFISSLNDTHSIVEGLNIGGWDFISKPYNKDEVLARVRNYLKLGHIHKRLIEETSQRLQQIQDAQQAILIKPEEFPEAKFSVLYQPILEAGGDFYDVFEINEGSIGYFVSDISGHDLGASFATSALKALIRQNSSQLYTPSETFQIINKILLSIFKQGQHLTAAFGCLNRKKNEMRLVQAAHLPMFHLNRHDQYRWIESEGDILGVFENGVYKSVRIRVEQGDRLFLFTDGLIESFGKNVRTREQGMQELQTQFIESAGQPLDETVNDVYKAMFNGERKPDDDVLLMAIEV